MSYLLNLFTPETWSAFQKHGADISGFRSGQRNTADNKVKVDDIFLCYLVRLSRWCGALRVVSPAFEDDRPIFQEETDPFIIRFKVKPIVLLEPEHSIPIQEESIWSNLSETKEIKKGSRGWGMRYRSSLRQIEDSDGKFLLDRLGKQMSEKTEYTLTDRDRYQLKNFKVQTPQGTVSVDVPEDEDDEFVITDSEVTRVESRQSYEVQAKIAKIGIDMGFNIWVPKNDKSRVLEHIPDDKKEFFLKTLPLNYNDTTRHTIELIDVIWLRKNSSIARAFEVEHTTAVYSGLLRMADLLALQPNIDIRLHIVAPDERRDKVLKEIRRPVFALLARGPLNQNCTFISYDSIDNLAETQHLSHMNDSIIDEYEEWAED